MIYRADEIDFKFVDALCIRQENTKENIFEITENDVVTTCE